MVIVVDGPRTAVTSRERHDPSVPLFCCASFFSVQFLPGSTLISIMSSSSPSSVAPTVLGVPVLFSDWCDTKICRLVVHGCIVVLGVVACMVIGVL